MEHNGVNNGSSGPSIGEVASNSCSNSAMKSGQKPSKRNNCSPSSSGMAKKRPRISWKQEKVEKTFLEACLHEITTNGREGSSLKAKSWKNVGERLKTEHDFVADQKQMKNRYDYLRAKFSAWTQLKNKTGNVYDPITNKFNMEEEEWQMEIKSNKYVKSLRTAPLPYPDLCIQLFDNATPLGFYGWGPSSKLPRPTEKLPVLNLNKDMDIDLSPMEEQPPTPKDSQATSDTDASSGESSARSKSRATKRKSKEGLDSMIIEFGEQISKLARLWLENNTDNVDACMEKLEKFEWGIEDPRYNTALLLFAESVDVRKVWLHLKPASCESWIRNAGRRYGYGLL